MDYSLVDLLKRAKDGDVGAFEEVFKKHNQAILNYLYRYVGDYQKAEDIAIRTFLEAYKRLSTYKEEGKFLGWVYRIATNMAKKEFRKKAIRKEVSLHTPITDDDSKSLEDVAPDERLRPDNIAMTNELEDAIHKALGGLNDNQRSVLLLCDMEGLSYEEAARALRCSVVTLGVRLNRARKALHNKLKEMGFEI